MNKPLKIATFEITLDLAGIPANRQWLINNFLPRPFFEIPLGKNVLVKKIEATADMGVLAPNNDIVIQDYQILFRLMEFNGAVLGIQRGLVINPVSGVWQVTSSTFDTICLSYSNPTLDFDEGIIMGGLELWYGSQFVLSNITTPLPAIARFYVNIYFQECDENN